METLSEMQNDCKTIRKLEEKIGKEKYIVMSYNTDWDNDIGINIDRKSVV